MYAAYSRVVSAPRFTDVDMEVIAMQLQQSFDEVERIFVYGGTGDASGTVVIITKDESLIEGFILFSKKCLSRPAFNTMSADQVRFAAFEETCPDFATWLKSPHLRYPRGAYFDILICPPDWQSKIKELEVNYFHPVPYYLQRMSTREPLFVT